MKNFEDVFKELLKDHREVTLSDVAKVLVATLGVLDEKSGNFAKVKAATKDGYTGMLNTLTLSIISNLAILGKTEEEAKAFKAGIKDKNVKSMTLVMVEEGAEE